jgi:hypothetical protein
LGFKDLRKRIRSQIKSNKGLISILVSIVAGIIAAVIILRTIIPPGLEHDIPNWMTMTVEVGVGIFIAALIFILQKRTGDSMRDLIKKIDQYNEEQRQHQESVRITSLEKIEGHLSSSEVGIAMDRNKIQEMEESRKIDFVKSLLRRDYRQSFPIAPLRVMEFEQESNFARSYIPVELHTMLTRIIEGIKTMYGLSPNFPPVAIVENWTSRSNNALELIKKSKEVVLKILIEAHNTKNEYHQHEFE